jgi:hypothetical protein
MRADAHYVDLLESRTSDARDRALADAIVDGPAFAGRSHDPAPPLRSKTTPHAPTAVEANASQSAALDNTLHAGRELSQSMATLAACTELLAGAQSDLSRAVAANLIRAETWRAGVLLYATRVIRQELGVARAPVAVAGLIERVAQGFLPERRIRAIAIDARSDMPVGAFMAGDEPMLTNAISCGVLSTLALLDGIAEARLVISVTTETPGQITFAVSQETVAVPQVWFARAFDPQWTDRAGGVTALVAMVALKRSAEAHAGVATAAPSGRGTRIAISVPIGL